MSYKKELLTAAGTLTCALGIGFIMQSGDAARERYGSEQPIETAGKFLPPPAKPAVVKSSSALMPAQMQNMLLDVRDITLTSAQVDPIAIKPAADSPIMAPKFPENDLTSPDLPENSPAETSLADVCAVGLTATPVAAAMVELALAAPCDPATGVIVAHGGMVAAGRTDDEGLLKLTLPALTQDATFEASLQDGKHIAVSTVVDSLPLYDRTVLLSAPVNGLELHAREFGAAYGTDGHVWSGAMRDIAAISAAKGGFIARFGGAGADQPRGAEVYTFPKALRITGDDVQLSVETEISGTNCGREIEARMLVIDDAGAIVSTDLKLSVPGCDAIGEFLVLNYPLRDLTVASR